MKPFWTISKVVKPTLRTGGSKEQYDELLENHEGKWGERWVILEGRVMCKFSKRLDVGVSNTDSDRCYQSEN